MFDATISIYEEILHFKDHLNPFDLGRILNNLGNAYKSIAQYNKALECFKDAIKFIADESDPFNNLGEVYYAKENYGSNSNNNINLNFETTEENILNFDKMRKYSYDDIMLNEPVLRKRTLSIVMDRINNGKCY